MSQSHSEMSRATRSLETVRNMQKLVPSFYSRDSGKNKTGLAWFMGGSWPRELLINFDLETASPENFGTVCASNQVATTFIDIAAEEGYSTDICSYLTACTGYAKRFLDLGEEPPELRKGVGLRPPTMLLGSGVGCEPRYKWMQTLATRYFKVPVSITDPMSPPFDIDVDDPEIAAHYKQQLRQDLQAQVTFLEEQTGRKLNIEKLRRALHLSDRAAQVWYETLQLRKAKPSPIAAEDYFSAIVPLMWLHGEEETVTFYETLYTEVKKRVDEGVGVIPDEKYRLMWAGGIPPWFNLGFFNYLESLGAVVCVGDGPYYFGPPVDTGLDRFDNPLDALVERSWKRMCNTHHDGIEVSPEAGSYSLCGPPGVQRLLQLAKDCEVVGALVNVTRSCRAVSFGQLHVQNKLREAGINTLVIESDMADPRNWSDARIKMQVEAFLEGL